MPSLVKRPDGKWRARYYDPAGRQHAKHFARRVDAQQWLDGIRGDLARGEYRDPREARRLFRDVTADWQASRVHRPTTRTLVESHLRLHILPALGDRPIGSIRTSELQGFVRGLSDKLAPATVTTVWRFTAGIFKAAVQDRIIPSSPCVGVKLPKRDRKQLVPLTVEQIATLEQSLPERYRALITLAAGTGLRQGEAFGLALRQVDFLGRRLDVTQQLVQAGAEEPAIAPPKSEASYRSIPLPRVVAETLARHIERFGTDPDGLLFTSPAGGRLRRARFGEVWRPAVERAGLPAGTSFHDLRHGYASMLISSGVSIRAVADRLGHADASVTLNVYAHLLPSDEERTREAIDAAFAARLEDQVRTNQGPATLSG